MKKQTERIGVVGSGLAGLSAACTLAARGYSVIVFEKNQWLGGKAAVLNQDGFRFDMGPTILTLPSVLRRVFAEANAPMEDYLDLVRLDPQWRCFYEDGSTLNLVEEAASMRKILRSYSPEPETADGYQRFMELSKRLHRVSDRHFFWKPVGGLRDMMNLRGAMKADVLKDILALRMGRSVSSLVRQHMPDPRVAQMMDHFTQYVGSAPDNSPAVLCGIAHMQTEEGIWYPKGGIGAVPKALAKLARSLGVEFRTGTGIQRIVTAGQKIKAVETDSGEVIEMQALVCNSDVVRTFRDLIDQGAREGTKLSDRYEPACSGVVLYLGLKKRYDHLAHHNFVFSRDPHEEFQSIYGQGDPAPDPTCYVCAPARTEAHVAPPGGEALYVLVHAPYLRSHHDWPAMLPAYRQCILRKLATTGKMPDLEDRIVTEATLTPEDIHHRYRVLNGAIYGLASHGRFLGAFKPSNRHSRIRGLYLAGGSVHPGPGMPMVLMSGWIAADALDRDGVANKGGGAHQAIDRTDILVQPSSQTETALSKTLAHHES